MKYTVFLMHTCCVFFTFFGAANAAITYSNDVYPSYPPAWHYFTMAYIGRYSNGTLDITEGSLVRNGLCYIGYDSTATGEVTVDGADSLWFNNENFYVGYNGCGALNIRNEGTVTVVQDAWVSYLPDSLGTIYFENGILNTGGLGCNFDDLSGTGTINTGGLVSDMDLVFDAAHGLSQTFSITKNTDQNITVNLNVNGHGSMGAGYNGVGTMSISDGRVIESYSGIIAYKSGSVGQVNVRDSTSKWNNGSNLYVGYEGSGTLNISDGGTVSNFGGYIGHYSGSTGHVTVNGPSSTWSNRADCFYVGYAGLGTLDITHGGTVSNHAGSIAHESGSTGQVTVNGTDATWTNSDFLHVGSKGQGTLNINNGGEVSSSYSCIGYEPGSTGHVVIDGTGSTWKSLREIVVGYSGSGSLDITNGGQAISASGKIGFKSESSGEVTVDGAGSKWTNSGDLGVFGTLTIRGSGEVSDQKAHVGNQTGSTTIATVSGSGSKWTNSSYLIAGSTGNGEIMINDGGLAISSAGLIGNGEDAIGLFTVDGNGSMWTNSGYLRVGDRGKGTLNITNGGLVSNTDADIGFAAGIVPWVSDSRGEVTVSGLGSIWTNSTLDVGYLGSGTLNIDDGGMVIVEGKTQVAVRKESSGVINFNNGTLTTGELISSINDLHGTGTINTHGLSSNVDLVFDASHGLNQTFVINENPDQNITVNLMIDGSGSIRVGYEGAGSMSISDGRVVESTFGDIGCKPGSSGIVTVDGVGSTWNNSDDLAIGISSTGTLAITNGGRVSNSAGYIATISIPDYPMVDGKGQVTVDGVGSTWTNSSSLAVGYVGNGTLTITGGGHVTNTMGFIGGGGWPDSTIGDVTVDGNGSKWTNSKDLRVGKGTLVITDGAQVEDTNGYIDLGSVTVDGAGSTWVNSGELIISDGNGKLIITGGGRVYNNSACIGQDHSSESSVRVDGVNSAWYINGDLSVGIFGDATLNITNCGFVRVDGTLSTNSHSDPFYTNNGVINLSNGGMLALQGEADATLAEFMDLIDGTDAINYWDDSISDWADILGATYGDDYSLSYLVGGSLDGYTVLSVGTPEPGIIGDSTHDGVVDAADAAILATYWQTESGALWEMGDFNGDGAVNEIDATLLAVNWHQTVEGNATVPEPSAFAGLLGLCLVGLLASPRRKR